ncbi:TPA: 50S ribosomal protein L18 [Patescibacteria group bacterium]|nr:MAG: 50S ribosomal protein L18 [Parcubacteria group bacterium GW2011_GWA2_46_39]HBV33556.1 50S ribosomal protein L18 [Patescibacteria group bacterium]HCU47809.1 50S ribosomal protein L18 [Patescibacteria group bacterium]
MKSTNQQKRLKRHNRIRVKVRGTATRPRLCLHRGTRSLIAQLINDDLGKTLVYLTDHAKQSKSAGPPMARAAALGKGMGEAAKAQGISAVVFDRSGWRYHGRVKTFADAVRAAGIKF